MPTPPRTEVNTAPGAHEPGAPDAPAPPAAPYLYCYIASCLALAAAIGAINWAIDPLQFYRKATLYPPVFSENQRYQNPGLSKHYDYEIAIVGDSHAENFSARAIEAKLGAPALNLAISGSTAHEQFLIARKAIETGKVRRVIWVLGRLPFRKPPDRVIHQGGEFPMHFYEEGLATHPEYLLSIDTLELSLEAIRGRGHRDLDSRNMWYAEQEFSQARMLMGWRRRVQVFDSIRSDSRLLYRSKLDTIHANIDENLAALITQHPEIRFDLVFPPYSVLSYLIDFRIGPFLFKERLLYKAAVVDAVADFDNAEVHDLQVAIAITHDFDNYKDLDHFSSEVNERILDAVATGAFRVDKHRYADVLDLFSRQVSAFRKRVCGASDHSRFLCPDPAGAATNASG